MADNVIYIAIGGRSLPINIKKNITNIAYLVIALYYCIYCKIKIGNIR